MSAALLLATASAAVAAAPDAAPLAQLQPAPTWDLVWGDEFDGTVVNTSLWTISNNVYEGPPSSSNQIELYTADNVFLDGAGHLVLRTQLQNASVDGIDFNVTSGRVDSSFKGNASFAAPGRVEVRARLQNDAASGIHTAHWLLGYGCWPVTAEIDLMESQSPHNVYADIDGVGGDWQVATSNYHLGTSCNNQTKHTTGGSAWPRAPASFNYTNDWTIFSVEWNKTAIDYYINATHTASVWAGMPGWSPPGAIIPDWDMYLILSQVRRAGGARLRPCHATHTQADAPAPPSPSILLARRRT